jgi:DUF1365 family protein
MTEVRAALTAGPAALALGRVTHRRHGPVDHRFDYPMTQIWIDPDDPDALFDRHRLWSRRHPSPVRFRRRDYLDGTDRPLGPAVRAILRDALGRPVDGPLRMLTQPRVWGWLFNPLTVYLAWDDGRADPTAALLEVSNTPWKERRGYPLALEPADPAHPGEGRGVRSVFAKALHVSPFLDLDHRYELGLRARGDAPTLELTLDVHPTGDGAADLARADRGNGPAPILETRLTSHLLPADEPSTARSMTEVLRPDRLPTHRVSAGIHRQAFALWRKQVPFVPHPGRQP